LQLCLDPVHRVAISLGALAPIAELRQAFERFFVLFQVEPGYELPDIVVLVDLVL
jgi:hypothetical protein